MTSFRSFAVGLVCVVLLLATAARADVFNMSGTYDPSTGTWDGDASLSFVTVGNPGNVADSAYDSGTGTSMSPGTGLGSVGYTYQMGTYDVTLAQYCQFLNAVASTDPYGLYNNGMGTDFTTQGIYRSGSLGSYSYSVTGSNPQAVNCPVFCVTWGDAARFCNWLCNGQGTATTLAGAYALTETGAYTLDGDTTTLLETRNTGAQYFLPSENEWYKAAYYNPSTGTYWTYPTQSNTAPINTLPDTGNHANFDDWYDTRFTDSTNYLTPVGAFNFSPGPYGTYDMGGDVFQWNEAIISGEYCGFRGLRGGSWDNGSDFLSSSRRGDEYPTDELEYFGFRVASSVAVPEPGGMTLLLAGGLCLLLTGLRWRRLAKR